MNSDSTDLEGLFNRLADGIASEADEENLGALLRSRPQARRAYRRIHGAALGVALGLRGDRLAGTP